jgi:hypothetical protein
VKALSLIVIAMMAVGCGDDSSKPPPPPPPVTTPPPVTAPPATAPVAVTQPPVAAGGLQSNFGTFTLSPGFQPDPHTVQGTSGGAVDATTKSGECTGWISEIPDHIFVAQAPFPSIRLIANGGDQDLTMVIQKQDGTFVCNDDGDGTHPVIAGGFPAGTHKIWIGSYEQGVTARYNLGVSEIPTVTAAQIGNPAGGTTAGGTAGGGQSNFGTVTLAPNFTPDPHTVDGSSGGAIQAQTLAGQCSGWVSQIPDHILVASGNFPLMRVVVKSSQDTTLVVQRPDGSYVCDDDSEGRNPIIAGAFPPGSYKVWVGSYREGQTSSYKIGFSELASTRARDLR